MPRRAIQVRPKRGLVLERFAVDVPAPRLDQLIQLPRRNGVQHSGQGRYHLMSPHVTACRDFAQRIAPPLQAHLGDHMLLRHPGRACDLHVERIDRKQDAPRRDRSRHAGPEPHRITALHDPGTGAQVPPDHAGCTSSSA